MKKKRIYVMPGHRTVITHRIIKGRNEDETKVNEVAKKNDAEYVIVRNIFFGNAQQDFANRVAIRVTTVGIRHVLIISD